MQATRCNYTSGSFRTSEEILLYGFWQMGGKTGHVIAGMELIIFIIFRDL
jgi:hypothetical protein